MFETSAIFSPSTNSLTSFYHNTRTSLLRNSGDLLGEYRDLFSVLILFGVSSTLDTSDIFDHPFPEQSHDFPPKKIIG